MYIDDNSRVLQKYHSVLYNKIINYEPTEEGRLGFGTEPTLEEQNQALLVQKGSKIFRLNSLGKPSEAAKIWAEQYDFLDNARVALLFGMGNGLYAAELLKKLNQNSRLIIYEPSMFLFYFCLEGYDLTSLLCDKRVSLAIGAIDKMDFKDLLISKLDFYRLETLIVAVHPQYDKLFSEEYSEFRDAISANRERLFVNRNTMKRFRNTGTANVLKNIRTIKDANLTEDLRKIWPKDIPVIIVSAGPSLDKNIEELRRAKGHSVIIAVDTAIKYLMQRDIMPDATIVVEPEKPFVHYADERSLKGIPLICDIEANPEIVLAHSGRKILYNCRDYVKNLLERCGKTVPVDIASGGSVATAAFALCLQLDIENIILIGQDLAYSGESTHAGGVESKGINNDIGYTMVEDIYGGQVRTRTDWLGYLSWFERSISAMKMMGKNIRVIDATEGGAKIHGTEIMTLAEAIDSCCKCEYRFENELEKLPLLLNLKEYEKLMRLAADGPMELEKAKKWAETAEIGCEKLLEQNCPEADAKAVRSEVQILRRKIEELSVYSLINNYAVTDIADVVSELEGRRDIDSRERELMQMKLAFEAIIGACDVIRGYYTDVE